ncbi:MAG: hypothetical protein ACJ8FY_11150 [Gemmataceae bacterium]
MNKARLIFGTLCFVLFVPACSSQKQAAPVNVSLAKESLQKTLDSWKNGEDYVALKQAKPSITVQDLDWKSGCKLVEYEIIGEGKYDDANLLCPVKLKLVNPQGKEVTRQVTYMVGTDPVITVFREMKF